MQIRQPPPQRNGSWFGSPSARACRNARNAPPINDFSSGAGANVGIFDLGIRAKKNPATRDDGEDWNLKMARFAITVLPQIISLQVNKLSRHAVG